MEQQPVVITNTGWTEFLLFVIAICAVIFTVRMLVADWRIGQMLGN